MSERTGFGTRLGVVLATAGSAVGLGNVWRFPYMTGQDGGAAFIVVYIVGILLLGIPGMIGEFVVGRHGAANAARAYSRTGGKPWAALGFLGALCSLIIFGFYSVIAGWCVQYLFASALGEIRGDKDFVTQYFQAFSSDPVKPIVWALVFMLMTHLVVIRGVRKGIEKVSNMLMPTLFVLLLIIVVAACSLPGAGKGIEFLFKPDFSKLSKDVFLDAMGQAFFSISLGTACLCTYASYFSRRTNLLKSATQIISVDTMVAILAGLMIFPAAFSVGVSPDSGPALIFITLPNVFQQAFSPAPGYIISVLFYALLVLASLTSTISMHEIGTAIFYEELHISRKKGAVIETLLAVLIAVPCALSCGAVDITLFGKSFLDCCDFLTSNILLPIGAFFTAIMLGWFTPKSVTRDQFTNWGTVSLRFYGVWMFLVRFIVPLLIATIFLHQLGIV